MRRERVAFESDAMLWCETCLVGECAVGQHVVVIYAVRLDVYAKAFANHIEVFIVCYRCCISKYVVHTVACGRE